MTMALNGQEWYLDKVGSEGRLGLGLELLVRRLRYGHHLLDLRGHLDGAYGVRTTPDGKFGFSFDRDDFAFEAADLLKTAGIEGQTS